MSVDNGTSVYEEYAELAAEMWERLAHHFADALVERWHTSGEVYFGPPTLAGFMELSDDQYAAWAEGRWKDVLK